MASGRATFVLGNEEIDAPAGTLVHAGRHEAPGRSNRTEHDRDRDRGKARRPRTRSPEWEEIFVASGLTGTVTRPPRAST